MEMREVDLTLVLTKSIADGNTGAYLRLRKRSQHEAFNIL